MEKEGTLLGLLFKIFVKINSLDADERPDIQDVFE